MHLAGKPSVGQMRNTGCEAARGDVIAHFDDDDFSHPERLADQIPRLNGAQVTGYHTMRFTDGVKWWLYHSSANFALGTSLVYRKTWWDYHRFENVNVGEDNGFVRNARAVLVTADAGEMQWATNHSGNTSKRALKGRSWKEL